ncbi:cob(I)yrinic acid a,c-diamide adenosyltransferase [bacterium]|nr:cob(I)yrinic acid a,c-diamide adenosyltransferase [bacterium]
MASFYTGKGDSGDTGYLGEGRLSKAGPRIEALGAVDEATAALGLARSLSASEDVRNLVLSIQKHLYLLMSELAASPETAAAFDKISDEQVSWLETQIADFEGRVTLPREFIIPGENPASGALSLARTVVRRAERRVVALLDAGGINKPVLVAYLNRLSSLIFILEVHESSLAGDGVRLAKEE